MIRADIYDRPADNATPHGENATATSPISPDGRPEPGRAYTVPAREGRAVRLKAGETITVVNTHGTQVCDLWAFAAANPAEYLSWEHARAGIGRIVPRVGDALLTNRRRPILTLVEDTSPGVHDTLIAACDLFRYLGLGCTDYHDNCSDNLRMAMAAIGAPGAGGAATLQRLDEHPRRRRRRHRLASDGLQSPATASSSAPRWTASSRCRPARRT